MPYTIVLVSRAPHSGHFGRLGIPTNFPCPATDSEISVQLGSDSFGTCKPREAFAPVDFDTWLLDRGSSVVPVRQPEVGGQDALRGFACVSGRRDTDSNRASV